MTGLDVEAVLRDHADWEQCYDDERSTVDAAFWRTVCSCGDLLPRGGFSDDAHRAHVAAVLRVEIAEWLSSERAQDAVADAMLDCNHNGMRCYDPVPIYPTAQAALSALTASLAADEGDRQ